jgi:membrane fusion protein, multidrug efflux system
MISESIRLVRLQAASYSSERITLSFCSIVAAAFFILVICGCRSTPSQDEDSAASQAPVTMAVTGTRVVVKPMRSELRLLGATEARRHISLRAPAAGRVIGFNLQIGDRVREGQIVAHILSREVQAAENGLAVARQIDPSEAPILTDSVRRYSRGAGVAVVAQESAVVAQRMVSSGQMVADLDQLADLIDPRSIFVNAAVPVDDLSAIRPGMAASVTSPLYANAEFAGRVAGISPSFNQAGATSPARIEFTGREPIAEAGAPVEVAVTLNSVPSAIVIPAAALFENAANDSFYVFVAGADKKAHRTAVIPGIRQQAEVQITSGLHPGQVVITSGGYALSDGLGISVKLTQTGP